MLQCERFLDIECGVNSSIVTEGFNYREQLSLLTSNEPIHYHYLPAKIIN